MAPRETETTLMQNFGVSKADQQRVLWYVMVFSVVVNTWRGTQNGRNLFGQKD